MAERCYRCLLWTLVVVGLSLDQASKYGVFKWLYNDAGTGQYEVVPGAFKLLAQFTDKHEKPDNLLSVLRTLSGPALPKVNQGALFGLGNQYAAYANSVFAIVSMVAAVAIAFWSTRRATARDWALCAALGLILAGTLGNLYDRLIFHGVRDFLYFYWVEWPVFNVADCCLVCGAFLLLTQAFWAPQTPGPRESEEKALSTTTAEVN
jgi:lipoprotein signal peptidase